MGAKNYLILKMEQISYACDSTTTRIVSGKHPNWFLNRPTDLVLCDNCYRSIVYYPTYRTIKKAYSQDIIIKTASMYQKRLR
jgi:hypothetical protein